MSDEHYDLLDLPAEELEIVQAEEPQPAPANGTPIQQPSAPAPQLFGQSNYSPQYYLKKEEPQHRAIALLAAQGFTTTEIAQQTGYTTATIAYVKKQPFIQQYITELMQTRGRAAVDNILQGGAQDAAKLLVDIVRDDTLPKGMRAREANNLLTRLYGATPIDQLHNASDLSQLSSEELAVIVQTGRKIA